MQLCRFLRGRRGEGEVPRARVARRGVHIMIFIGTAKQFPLLLSLCVGGNDLLLNAHLVTMSMCNRN